MAHTTEQPDKAFLKQPQEQEGLSLLEILMAIGYEKAVFFCVLAIGGVLTVACLLWTPRYYTANTLIMLPQQQASGMAALAQLGTLANLAGAAGAVKTADELYVALLKSRSVQDEVIRRFELKTRYEVATLHAARAALLRATSIVADKKAGLISIEVDDQDATMAAHLANGYVEQLKIMLTTLAVTEAQQRRAFFERQVEETKKLLATSELSFKQAQAKSGLMVAQVLAESGLRAATEFRAQIAMKEVQLEALSRYATPQHPEVRQVLAELAAMRQQLNRLEGGGSDLQIKPGAEAAVNAYRDVKLYEAKLETLIKQAELAKLEESREGPLLQQVDPAQPPELATKPSRRLVLGSSEVSGDRRPHPLC